jgi:hypothetical protein
MRKTYPTIGILKSEEFTYESMVVTISDLKENRDEIIKHILSLTSQDAMVNVMTKMVEKLGKATCYIKLANEVMADLGLFNNIAQELAEDTLRRNKQLMSIR